MRKPIAAVRVVDDDTSVREALGGLLRSAGFAVETFASAQEFLARPPSDLPGCLVLDVRLPGLSGLDLQQRMAELNIEMPIVFITGHGDVPTSVRAMKAGAVEFLTKPFGERDLLDAIRQAIDRDQAARRQHAELSDAARARGAGAGGVRIAEQADRGRAGDERDHHQGPSGPGDAENAGRLVGRPGENGRTAAHPGRQAMSW